MPRDRASQKSTEWVVAERYKPGDRVLTRFPEPPRRRPIRALILMLGGALFAFGCGLLVAYGVAP